MNESAAHTARRPRVGAPLPTSFYDRQTELVARDLLGAVLSCKTSAGTARGRIVETEAYLGPHDPACHAVAGRTSRTFWLFGPPGVAYVYFVYGVHWCVNAVTREEGHGSAVLIRALEPLEGIALMRKRRRFPRSDRDLANGPGKLCEALGITGEHNGLLLQESRSPLTISRGVNVPNDEVALTSRIGITRASDWPLRWYVKSSVHVSRRSREP
ncbi:MAG: DNA-3-methyladenine glycosylase [Gemmatimonadaceae bacterium]